jgi:hypothetical protein
VCDRTTGAAFPTEEELAEELSNHPELIEPWVLLSEDQRVSSGWYLQRPGDNRDAWEVGYYPTSVRESYESGVAAAAAFIARYISAQSRSDELRANSSGLARAHEVN